MARVKRPPLIEGEKYGHLTFLGNVRNESREVGDFLCDCGLKVTKACQDVKRIFWAGKIRPCCSKNCSVGKIQYVKDITGEKRNKLTAICSTWEKSSNGDYIWEFQCDCGNTCTTTIGRFRSDHTRSCGCLVAESHMIRENYHGLSKSSEYKSWCKIKERCYNENDKEYPYYGAIGVTMSDEWRNDFRVFLSDMGMKPDDGKRYTVDRIDNTKGYEKDNCRWATNVAQARNKLGLQKNNKTGVKGVHWDQKSKGSWYAKVTWRNLVGEACGKVFSVKKYGEELALFLAAEYRTHMIDLLNLQGAGYTEQHLSNEQSDRWS